MPTGKRKFLHHMNTELPEISVVIPAFNEESRLKSTLSSVSTFLRSREIHYEVLVVDDGSSDATSAVARGFAEQAVHALQLDCNQGKGAAVRHGILSSRGAQVLISDADLSTPIEDLLKLRPHLQDVPIVIGSRAVEDSDVVVRQPIYRELMGKTFNKLIRLAGVWGIDDTQCGFKLLDGDVARRLFDIMITPGFAFDVELVWLAGRLGFGVREVGVAWHNSPSSRVQPLLDPPKMLLEILRFRIHHRGLKADPSAAPPSS